MPRADARIVGSTVQFNIINFSPLSSFAHANSKTSPYILGIAQSSNSGACETSSTLLSHFVRHFCCQQWQEYLTLDNCQLVLRLRFAQQQYRFPRHFPVSVRCQVQSRSSLRLLLVLFLIQNRRPNFALLITHCNHYFLGSLNSRAVRWKTRSCCWPSGGVYAKHDLNEKTTRRGKKT